MQFEKSHAAFQKAKRLIPGGVNSPARAFGAVGGQPLFIARGEGAYLYDIDGNCFIDYVASWGPMILGHAHPEVVAAVESAVRRGTSFGAPTEAETELAELIVEAFPSIERVRLVNSGTEAAMSAIRLARAYTGRDLIVKFAGNYHGHVDSLLVAAGSSATTLGVPSSPGVTAGTAKDTLVLEYNDVVGLEEAFAQWGSQIAAVIVEPVAGNMGVVKAQADFRQALRELTSQHGALLIFDEVITGFRVCYGGAQTLFGIQPDLTILGKILGGGLPIGAYGGRADIMDQMLPSGKVFQAGTLSGNPLATAAGIATLKVLRQTNPYPYLEQLSTRLAVGLEQAAKEAEIPVCIGWFGSMMTLFFTSEPVVDWPSARRCNTQQYAQYFWGMLRRGVYLPCSQFEALFISAAHTPDHIDTTITAAKQVMKELKQR
ncbi:MAG: glutamate-1-semialdehyde 2,1-aminomutase [Thermoguttaceae bacterium]|nr:glutamate-1-semialdehyde 2,1-aminomutase [Thermoguttaceae bacterium]MDW8039758.1 glutamate-1-semialdehyde 2,1-aminomutase [Thermoguttaceae bacterium]